MEAFCLNDHHVNNVIFYAILAGPPNPPLTLEINKKLFLSNMKSKINERTLAKVFLSVLKGEEILGISVYRADLKNILKKLLENQVKMYYLHERGKNIDCSIFNHDRVGFILGDQRGLLPSDEKVLEKYSVPKISLGKKSYLSSYCILVLNFLLTYCKTFGSGPAGI